MHLKIMTFKHKHILHYGSPCKNIHININKQIYLRNTADYYEGLQQNYNFNAK